MQKEKILVVDDEKNICDLLRMYLEKEGYEVAIANNGADVEEINLSKTKEDFSPHSKVMVICNPPRDYSESEIRKIEDFLNNGNMFGRNLMFFSDFVQRFAINYNLSWVVFSRIWLSARFRGNRNVP